MTWECTCVGSQVQRLDIEVELSLSNESDWPKPSSTFSTLWWAQAWSLFVDLVQVWAKLDNELKHSLFDKTQLVYTALFVVAGATVDLHPIILSSFSPTSTLTLAGHHLHKILNLKDRKIKHAINQIYLNKKSLVKQRILNPRPICTSKCRGLKEILTLNAWKRGGKRHMHMHIYQLHWTLLRYYNIAV